MKVVTKLLGIHHRIGANEKKPHPQTGVATIIFLT
jgi:hypothetical protein